MTRDRKAKASLVSFKLRKVSTPIKNEVSLLKKILFNGDANALACTDAC